MTLALVAFGTAALLFLAARTGVVRGAAAAPALTLLAGAAVGFLARATRAPAPPTDWIASAGEAGLAALVFVSAAQLRVSRFARHCPASFRLTLGGAPLFLLVASLCAFVLMPQLSLASALLVGGALSLNGAAFDRRAVTSAPAPPAIKAAVRMESAAIVALGAPVAIFLAANAAPDAGSARTGALFAASIGALKGFALGGAIGVVAARFKQRISGRGAARTAFASGVASFLLASLIGADSVIAAGAAGLLWGEATPTPGAARLKMRRLIEFAVAPAAYFTFGCALAPRILEADLLTILFAAAAATILRVGPRLAVLQTSKLPRESQGFLAWFGGAPGAASALFLVSILDDTMIVDHEAVLTVGALSVIAGVCAARLTSRPLAQSFLRRSARHWRQAAIV